MCHMVSKRTCQLQDRKLKRPHGLPVNLNAFHRRMLPRVSEEILCKRAIYIYSELDWYPAGVVNGNLKILKNHTV